MTSHLSFTLTPHHPRFSHGETIAVTAMIQNLGPSPIVVPDIDNQYNTQPIYSLTGPTASQTRTFSGCDPRFLTHGADSHPLPLQMITLKPGETNETELDLGLLVDMKVPGNYTLSGVLSLSGDQSQSPAISFVVSEASSGDATLGFGPTTSGLSDLYVTWLSQSQNDHLAFQRLFSEDRPDLAEISTTANVRLASVGADATDPLNPCTNYSRMDDLFNWIGWREKDKLLAQPSYASAPLMVTLPASSVQIVRPSLMSPSHTLDVFFLTADSTSLGLVRFYSPSHPPSRPPQILWQQALPAKSEGIIASLGPREAGSERRIAFVSQRGQNLEVFHANLGDANKATHFGSATIANAFLLPHSQPGLYVDSAGISHVAVLFETDREAHRFAITDLEFDAHNTVTKQPVVTPLGKIAQDVPEAASVSYYGRPKLTVRRDWALLLKGGRLIVNGSKPGSQGRMTPRIAHAVQPLQILSMSQAQYILVTDPESGPHLVTL